MSISLHQCTNINQFHQAGGYAALYGKLSSRSHDYSDFKSVWVTAARTLCERDPDREWIAKWSANALTYGGSSSTSRPPSLGSDAFVLFIATSWYLLRNEEPGATEMHNICRSELNLSNLPNGFRFVDIVVEVIDAPADVQPVDNHAPLRKTASHPETQVIGVKYLDRNRSVSPLTDLEEHEGLHSFVRPRKKAKGRHSQLDNHQPTAAGTELRRRRSQRLASTAGSKDPQHQHFQRASTAETEIEDLRRSTMNDTNISQSTDFENTMSSEEEPLINTRGSPEDARRALRKDSTRKTKKGAALVSLSVLGGMPSEGEVLSTFALPSVEDYDTHVGRPSPFHTSLKRKVTLNAYNPDLECEPPRKRLESSIADSGSYSGKNNQQQITPISNSLPIPEPATMTIGCETSTDTIAQQPENIRKKGRGKGKGKGKVQITQPSAAFPGNDTNIQLYTSMIAERRTSRIAAHKAQGKIHEQYLIDPVDPMKDVQISNDPVPDRKSCSKDTSIDKVRPVNTVLPEPQEVRSEPLKGLAKGNDKGKSRRGRRGKKKGKNKSKRVNLSDNEDEDSTTLPSITIYRNPNTSELVSNAIVSHSTTCVSSPTAVACSSSSTACSSPLVTTPANDAKKPPAWASLHFTRLGPSRKKQSEKPTISLPDPDQIVPPFVSQSQCQYEDQVGLNDSSDAYVQPIQSVPVQCPPWSMPHDGTNYSNGIRIPGSNDTHSWKVSKSRTVEFPPLQGESLCPDIRLHKPELPNQPPVWSHSRQELCESLSYFRAYQGGVYTHKQRAEGYLLDGYPARYDIWHSDGRYIISHGGGHSAVDKLTGRTSLVEDQASDSASCAALISTWKAGQPIAVIAGSGYKLFPFSLGERNYVVLGYYHIIHAWEEPEPSTSNPRGYCVRWKFLFRWIEAQGPPWWLNENERPRSSNNPLPSQTCASCNKSSCHIFSYGWVCTHSDCPAFFELSDKSNITHEGYNLDFLAPQEDPPGLKSITLDVRPQPPVRPIILPDNTEKPQLATSRHFWKGFWCEKCGKLSCREFWTYWKCSNCKHMFVIKATIQVPPSLGSVKMKIVFDRSAGVEEKLVILGDTSDPYRCHTFVLPFNRGRIHVIKASQQSLQIANRIFQQYQLDASNEEMFFRRYSMKTHKLKGRMLSHYFSQNSGEPYAYVGGTNNTVELNKYRSVTKALDYIRTRATLALGWNPEFNEVLSAAYMEEQKMEYHSDGEKDLGPIVASLSLGSPAIMKFRPVPSKWMSTDGQMKEGRKTPPVIIELTLRHGDALVMEGAEIQEYYQHAVHPCGFRIAATARRVNIT